MEMKVLLVEDDLDIADLIKLHLRDAGYIPDHAADGETGLEKALNNDYALVILDLMLPKMDGLEVCKRIREKKKTLPILMLTSKSEEFDKVLGLELGADDYLTKPFSLRELMARIKAIIRRMDAVKEEVSTGEGEKKEYAYGDLVINLEKRKVWVGKKEVELTAKEFDLLALFAAHPGRAYTRQELLDIVWGYQFEGYDHTVNSHINRLRSKIEKDPSQPRYIQTVWGVGYRFVEPEELDE
ncbi:MAG: DNA-binding response regulator [Calditrichaeota bacterium]|nr:MAG: DNA-binding response regulator [Calditrichota bacterium]